MHSANVEQLVKVLGLKFQNILSHHHHKVEHNYKVEVGFQNEH